MSRCDSTTDHTTKQKKNVSPKIKRKPTNFNIFGVWNQIEKIFFYLSKKINFSVSRNCYKDKTKISVL